ncbi:hypothetical protein [Streptomyces malaysiensis]|uniref:hypothetical protein n=1 Tax=Streptomyces malaysiensis TaxID=92644 RepID=UPI0037213C47
MRIDDTARVGCWALWLGRFEHLEEDETTVDRAVTTEWEPIRAAGPLRRGEHLETGSGRTLTSRRIATTRHDALRDGMHGFVAIDVFVVARRQRASIALPVLGRSGLWCRRRLEGTVMEAAAMPGRQGGARALKTVLGR